MSTQLILFFILAVIAILSAIGMLVSKNSVYSAMFLVLNFVTIAVLFLLLNAPFIAMVQVTIYAGAIMVLFLFVIMLLGTDMAAEGISMPWQPPIAILLSGALILEFAFLLFFAQQDVLPQIEAISAAFGSPQSIGKLLFNFYLLPFEVTSVLLLVAMVGAIILAQRETG